MAEVRSATRANLPNWYACSLVSPPPPKQPTASRPCSAWVRSIAATIRSSASSHVDSTSGLVRSPGTARNSGRVSRSGWSSSSGADQTLEHRPPRLVGKSAGCSVAGRSPAVIVTPHCSEQYGQWVCVVRVRGPTPASTPGRAVAVTPTRFRGRRFPAAASASSLGSGDLTASRRRLLARAYAGRVADRVITVHLGAPSVRPAEQRDVPRIAATLTLALAASRWTRWALPEDGRVQRLTRLHELDAGHRAVATGTA